MAVSASFLEQVREALAAAPELRTRRMFGGVGVFSGERMFALAIADTLYLKSDAVTAAEFDELALEPFRYATKTGEVRETSYRQAPEEVWEDPDVAAAWTRRALEAAWRKG
ncbi:TfoX/Sxy family protein [Phenylobacterium sp.]|uniref:TfoX/Sxy family protein n=1 Tax=Phenylobacterium sp. TaxID=1871053 RepID=UPI0035B48A4E